MKQQQSHLKIRAERMFGILGEALIILEVQFGTRDYRCLNAVVGFLA